MRKLMLFAVGFEIAALICAYLFCNIATVIVALVCGLFCIALLLLKNDIGAMGAVVCLGLAAGLLYCWGFHSVMIAPVKAYDGKTADVSFEASDYAFETDYGVAADGTIKLDGKSYRVRMYLDRFLQIQPGDTLYGSAKLRYTLDGGLEQATYHKGEGIYLLAYGDESMEHTAAEESSYFVPTLRKNIKQRIDQIFPGDTGFFAKALLLGDDSGISYSDQMSLQNSGIRHVVAVSGMHVSLLFSILFYIFGRRKTLLAIIGLPVLFLFAALAGFTPSVVRACVMQALVTIAIALEREPDPPSALAFSAMVMTVVNPLVVTSVSFQLSVGCMVGVFAFSGRLRQWFYSQKLFKNIKGKGMGFRCVRWIIGTISVTLSTMTVTMPLCAFYFNNISIIGIVNNIVTLWVISFIFCGILFACVLSVLWMPLGIVTGWIIAWPIRFVLFAANVFSKIPLGTAYTDSPYVILWIIVCYCLLILYFLSKKKRPLWLGVSILALYLLAVAASYIEPRLDNFRVSLLDVGQGQCILLQSKNDAYLIDCGGEDPERTATVAHNAMRSQGIRRLNGVILTHFDEDHCNGAPYLLQVNQADNLYLPNADATSEIRQQLQQQEIPIQWVEDNISIPCGKGEIHIIPGKSGANGNESSMCILFQCENCDILITGDRDLDGEHLLLQQFALPDIEVLVAGHHGANTSTGAELLMQTKPELVLISVGKDNLHGHPDPFMLSRLKQLDCVVRRTDLEGTITVRG